MVHRVNSKHAKACFSFADEQIVRLLKAILQSSVCDWTKENFEENEVNRASNGKFTKGGGAQRDAEKEHYHIVDNDLMDYIDVEFPSAKSKITYIDKEAMDRGRYSSSVAVVLPKDGLDTIQSKINELNKTIFKQKGITATTEIHPRNDDKVGMLITLLDHKEMRDYVKNITDDFVEKQMVQMSRQSHENEKQASENQFARGLYLKEHKKEEDILKEITNGTQKQHMTASMGYNRGFMFDKYVEALKGVGVTDEEIATAYLFTVAPTSIRMAGENINQIDKAERDTCHQVMELTESFIEKSPKWGGGTLYRGCVFTQDGLDEMLQQKEIDMRGASSWSSDQDIAESFADTEEEGKIPVVFRIPKTQQGASVATFSNYPYEQEVVISHKARFKPIKTTKSDDGIIFVDMEEI